MQHKKGQEVEANEGMARYWKRVGVCESCDGTSSIGGFDPIARAKELKSNKFNAAAQKLILVSYELDPENYKNQAERIAAIIEAETPVIPSPIEVNALQDHKIASTASEDFSEAADGS